jgi:hypothetical protein
MASIPAVHLAAAPFISARAARQWALRELRGTFRNIETQREVAVARRGIEKATSGSGRAGKTHIQAIQSLPDLIGNAVILESRPPMRPCEGLLRIHRFYAAAYGDGTLYRVKITVKEMVGGLKFYDQSLTQIAQSPDSGGALLRGSGDSRGEPVEPVSHGAAFFAAEGITGPSDLRVTIAQLFAGAKYDDETFIWPVSDVGNASGAAPSIAVERPR